jgi:hypothetical protein
MVLNQLQISIILCAQVGLGQYMHWFLQDRRGKDFFRWGVRQTLVQDYQSSNSKSESGIELKTDHWLGFRMVFESARVASGHCRCGGDEPLSLM